MRRDESQSAGTNDLPYVLGIVGGIGAGKSFVASRFASLGVPVFDADSNSKSHLEDSAVIAEIREAFGAGVLDEATGRVDRAALAGVVFADRASLDRLQSILHPRVLADQRAFIERAHGDGAPIVMIDAPLLLEAGFDSECDAVVFVEASEATRRERVVGGRGWTEEAFRDREASQWPLERKKAACRFVVHNDAQSGSIEEQIRSIIATIRRAEPSEG